MLEVILIVEEYLLSSSISLLLPDAIQTVPAITIANEATRTIGVI
jgi:hypothetical protein